MNHANAGLAPGLRGVASRVASAVIPVFPPSPDDWRPFGPDIWEGYGNIDFGKLKAYENPAVDFLLIRSGQGHPTPGTPERFYKDPQFAANVNQATTLGIPYMQYHVFLPNYSDTRRQADYAYQLAEETGHMPLALWWDHQLSNGVYKNTIAARLKEVWEFTRERSEQIKRTGIYSAKWVFNQICPWQAWMTDCWFWWASWWTSKEKPYVIETDLPEGMQLSQVKVHQTSSNGDGKLLGSQTRRMDFNRAMMSKNDLYKWLGVSETPTPDTMGERVTSLEQWRNEVKAAFAEIAGIT